MKGFVKFSKVTGIISGIVKCLVEVRDMVPRAGIDITPKSLDMKGFEKIL
jgi:hypothetical protein